mgnify:CR=1 FL=1
MHMHLEPKLDYVAPRSPGASPKIRISALILPKEGTGALCQSGLSCLDLFRNARSLGQLLQETGAT